MKFGFSIPNFNKRIEARTSLKKYVLQNLLFNTKGGYG